MSNSNQMSLFDMFEEFGVEAPAEVKKEEKKPATVTAFPSDEAVSDGADDEDVSDDAAAEESVKPAAPKTTTKSKSEKKIPGPVKVVGTGWEYSYGEAGKSYEPKQVLKALYDEGFKEIACASFSMPKDGNVIYVNAVGGCGSDDSVAVGGNVTVILARKACNYSVSDFDGLDEDELSVFDVREKFTEAHPEFKGCSLKFKAGIAVPQFDTSVKLKPDSSETIKVWREDGIREYIESEASLLFDGDVTLYKSESGIYYPAYSAKGKGVRNIYLSENDLGLESGSVKHVTEKYALPATIYLETFGQRLEVTGADFGGKAKITKQELIDFLKPKYRVFQSTNRKFDVIYEKAQNIVSVAVISGEKGAAVAAFPLLSVPRVEKTDVGVFSGRQSVDGLVTGLDFTMGLPKIPQSVLNAVIHEFRRTGEVENMLQIYWNKKGNYYYLQRPFQIVDKVHVGYEMFHSKDVLVLTIHSHNTFAPNWSATDDADEVYTGLFGVIGHIDHRTPSMRFRAGMEGSFKELSVSDLFETDVA